MAISFRTRRGDLDAPTRSRKTQIGEANERLGRDRRGAFGGERQIVFITGEPGIGKTTLVDAFLQSLGSSVLSLESQQIESRKSKAQSQGNQTLDPRLWIGRGQCIEQYGTGEAYMPVLEALERLCHTEGGERLVRLLRQYAPMWLVQMPSLLTPAEREELQRQLVGTMPERMLREMAHAIEALTVERPLVLVLEDLHWSDSSTISLAAFLARQPGRTRLLVIGTYRPVTEGNPLFMSKVVDYLVGQKLLVQRDGQWDWTNQAMAVETPTDIRQFLEQQIDRVSPEEQRVLEVASVAGAEFSAAAVAAGAETEIAELEALCTGLARRDQFLRTTAGEAWPDGTVAAHYGFIHALYQEVVYERVTAGQRVVWHRRIGAREEHAYGERVREIAAELALHFERGRDYRRAISYLQQAGENAAQRSAYMEATSHFTKGLALLQTLPDTPERAQQELALQIVFGSTVIAIKGFSSSAVERVYARARELCRQVGETPQLFPALWRLWHTYTTRGELAVAGALGEQLLALAQSTQDPALLLQAHHALWTSAFLFGDLSSAREHVEQGLLLHDYQQHRSHAFLYGGHDPGTCCQNFASWALWLLGYPDQALQRSQEALTLAREPSYPYSLAQAFYWAAGLHQFRRERQTVQEQTKAAITLSTEQGFPAWLAQCTILQGWALAEQGQGKEGITQIRQGLAILQGARARLWQSHFLALLAETYGKTGQPEEGLTVLAEALALVHKNGERYYEAELYRLRGELTLQKFQVPSLKFKVPPSPQPLAPNTQAEAEAEACFLKAIDIARKQQAKSLELRAVMSLVRLRQQQATQHATRTTHHETRSKLDEAHRMLSNIYNRFTEGFDTKDLQEAETLLKAQ